MSVPSGVVFGYTGTNASIPTGFSRDTTLDGRFIRGAIVDGDAGTTGGANTHTHTTVGHTHTVSNHAHSVTLANNIYSRGGSFGTKGVCRVAHTHTSAGSGNPLLSVTTTSVTVVLETMSNNPSYYEVIWIKSDGTPSGVPVGGVVFYDDTTLPTDYSLIGGNTFLRGAGTDQDAGTTGGSNTHSHDEDGSHSHTQNNHTHASVTTNLYDDRSPPKQAGTYAISAISHSHTVSFSNDGAGSTGTETVTTQNTDSEPPFYKLSIIENTGISSSLPVGVIAVWNDTHSAIPANWQRYTLMDEQFLKGYDNSGDGIGDTGGGLQHTHTADAHNHTGYTHNHAASRSGPSAVANAGDSPEFVNVGAHQNHLHSVTIGNTTPTIGNTTITVNNNTSGNALPEYREVIFIEFLGGTTFHTDVLFAGGGV